MNVDERRCEMATQRTSRKRGGPGVIRLAMAALTVGAVVKELRKEPEDRTWNGQLAGVVPYDFRMPTVERVKERLWDPDGDHLISPHVFGVGWTVNVGKVVALVRRRVEAR